MISHFHILTTCWNEEYFLPFFLDHCLRQGFDRITVVDNGSRDGSVGILEEFQADRRAAGFDAAFDRLRLPAHVPDWERAIYRDVDLIVGGEIGEL